MVVLFNWFCVYFPLKIDIDISTGIYQGDVGLYLCDCKDLLSSMSTTWMMEMHHHVSVCIGNKRKQWRKASGNLCSCLVWINNETWVCCHFNGYISHRFEVLKLKIFCIDPLKIVSQANWSSRMILYSQKQ